MRVCACTQFHLLSAVGTCGSEEGLLCSAQSSGDTNTTGGCVCYEMGVSSLRWACLL